MWASWRGIKYIIKGKVVASPKSGPWWILWVRICPWLVLAPKVLQLCTDHLMFNFVQVHVSSWCLSLFLVPSWSSSTPLYPQSAMSQGMCPNSLFFRCFRFRLIYESIKELGSASHSFFESFKAPHLLASKESPQKKLLCIKIEHSLQKEKRHKSKFKQQQRLHQMSRLHHFLLLI